MKNFKCIVVLFTVVALTSCKDQITTPQDSTSEKIVFATIDKTNPSHVFALDSSGSNKQDWGAGYVFDAGTDRILWATGTTEDDAVFFTSNNAGADRKNLSVMKSTSEPIFGWPAISPDGSKIAYATYDSNDYQKTHLYIVNADGTNPIELSKTYAEETRFCFSPDSKSLAYFSGDHDGPIKTIEIVAANGTSRVVLTPVNQFIHDGNGSISWSSQNVIAYTDSGFVCLINADGSGKMTLTEGFTPQWSPDGITLAFSSEQYDIMTTSDKGISYTNLTNSLNIREAFPKWSADGKRMLVTRWLGKLEDAVLTLEEITVDSKQSRLIASPGGFGYYVK